MVIEKITAYSRVEAAINDGDLALGRDLLGQYAEDLRAKGRLDDLLRHAAEDDKVEMVSLLVEFGADIHAPSGYGDPPSPEGVIDDAASNGALKVVRWLLEHGAKVNYQVEGSTRCLALVGAVNDG